MINDYCAYMDILIDKKSKDNIKYKILVRKVKFGNSTLTKERRR